MSFECFGLRGAAGGRALWLGALALVAVGVHAAPGFRVTHEQEALVGPGMSMSEVQAALGRPATNVQYRNEPGRTFTYRVSEPGEDMLFDVDFDADGRVAKVSERIDEDAGGGGGHGHHGRH